MEKEELPLPVDLLVHQCIEQCFVGSMIRLCFRGLHPCLTDSQVSRSSPTHLKNILTKIHQAKMNYLPRQQQNSSHLLASYMSRPEDTEKSATVFDLLKEYLGLFRCSKSITPSGCTNGPNSMSSSGPKHNTSFQSNSRLHYKGFGRKSYEDFNLMVSPLVLSCETRGSSQSSATGLSNLKRGVDLPIQIGKYKVYITNYKMTIWVMKTKLHVFISCEICFCVQVSVTKVDSIVALLFSETFLPRIFLKADSFEQSPIAIAHKFQQMFTIY